MIQLVTALPPRRTSVERMGDLPLRPRQGREPPSLRRPQLRQGLQNGSDGSAVKGETGWADSIVSPEGKLDGLQQRLLARRRPRRPHMINLGWANVFKVVMMSSQVALRPGTAS